MCSGLNIVYMMSGQADKILQSEYNRDYNTGYSASVMILDSMTTGASHIGWPMLTESLHNYDS